MVVSTAGEIDNILNSFTSKPNGIPGVVVKALGRDGKVLYSGTSGHFGLDDQRPITQDAVFWIASCTKALTIVGAMQLWEQGKLALDEPAEQYLPEIGTFQILEGFDAQDNPIYRAPKTKITLRQLITHTSGHTYDFFNPNTYKHNLLRKVSEPFSTKPDTIRPPLGAEPGTKWEYGLAIDWVGQIIEAVTGQTLDDYLKKNLFHPLGAHSITFLPTEEMTARHARLHARAPDGTLKQRDYEIAGADKVEVHLGGAGLHSTAGDYLTIIYALLNGGVGANGTRILKKETTDLLFEDQTTPRGFTLDITVPNPIPYLSNPVPIMPGVKKGWNFIGLLTHDPLPTGRSAGSTWWAGIANTYWWLDRTNGVVAMILTQILPFADGEVFACWNAFEKKLYEGLATHA